MKLPITTIIGLLASFGGTLASSPNRNSSQAVSNATMAQILPDVDFNFITLNTLAMATYQGSDIGEVLVAANQVTTGDFESFYSAFWDLAQRVGAQAQSINPKGHPISARNALFRQATYLRTADVFLHGNWADPRINSLWKQQAQAFDKAAALLPIPGQRLHLAAQNFSVPAIFYRTHTPGKRPTIILGTGYDGAMEDLYHVMGEAALQRGMNVLVYEGPGQPTVRRFQDLGFIPNWEAVVKPVVDYALSRKDVVDGSKIALMGFSFGGFLAPRAAAFEHRLAAVIALDGIYDFGQALLQLYGPDVAALFKAGKAKELDDVMEKLQNDPQAPSSARWGIDQGKWSFRTHSAYDLLQQAQSYTLKDVVSGIKAPVFVGDGQGDMFFPGQAKQLAQQLGDRATYHLFENIQGSGLHCQVGAYVSMNQVALDWLEDVFSNKTC